MITLAADPASCRGEPTIKLPILNGFLGDWTETAVNPRCTKVIAVGVEYGLYHHYPFAFVPYLASNAIVASHTCVFYRAKRVSVEWLEVRGLCKGDPCA